MLTRMSRLVGLQRSGGRSPQRGCAGYAASARRGLGVARWLLFLAVGVGLWGAASGQTNPWLENIKPGTSLPVGKTDSHGNYLVVKAYRGFEESEYPEKTSDFRIDAGGWTMESKNFSIAKWILWEGGSGPANGSIHYPSGAKVGKHNALNAFFGSGRQTYLVTPPTNVGSREVSDPALYFWFAAMANQNSPDELQIYVRNKRSKNAAHKEFKNPIAIFRNEGEGGWVEVQVKLNDAFKGWSEEDKQSVQFGFLAIGNNGWGICLDELMLIDLGGKPAQVSNVGLSQLIQPLGQDSKLNEIFRVDIGVGTGSGKYKIKEFKPEFDGDPTVYARSVEHLYLYHSKLPTFDSHLQNRMATITMQGGKVTNIAWEKRGTDQHEDRFLEPGQRHYLWLVADIKSNAQPKDVLRFKAPRSAIELVYCDNRGEENPKVGSKIYPIEQEWTAGEERKCTIYKTLFSDSFENGVGNWTLSTDWKVGQICTTHHTFADGTVSQHPSRAFGGTGVLATAIDGSGACAGKIQPMYSPNRTEEGCTAVKANIDASIYRNVLVRFRYAASLGGSNDRVSLFVQTPYGPQKVWLENSGVRDTGWKTAVVEIRDYADRVQNLTLGFSLKSDATDENAGLLIDDFQVLGDYIKADVGVENILPPTTLEFNANSKITVRVKNYGAEAVDASKVTVTVKVNGEEMVLPGKMGSIAAGATLDWEFTSNRLVPVTNRNNEIVVEATAKIPDDDGTDNDTKRVRFYSFPRFEVSAINPWPKNTDIRMEQWYPTTYPGGGASSWLQSFKELCSKCASGRMFSADPPVNKFIWTTGNERNNTHENSVLTGPIFDLKADANVKYEVVVTHMLSERAKMWIEYRTDVNAPSASTEGWTTLLPPTGGWSENWYDGTANAWVGTSSTSPGPEPMPVPYSYKVSKTMLPVQSGKVQLRVRFNDPDNAEANEGAAVNMIRVQALKADLAVTGFTPQPQCTNTPSSTPLKIKVKNNGPVVQKSFMCPVHVVVREMQEYQRPQGTRTPDLPVPSQVVLVDKILSLQIPDINVGEEKEIDTELAFAWDWADWGYAVDIALNVEQSSQGSDENTTNNSYSGSYIPKMYPGLFFAEADPATRQIAVPSQISPNMPVTLYQRNRRAWANHMSDNLELGTAHGSRNAREGVFYSFTSDGTFKIKFKYSYGVNEGRCPEATEEYTLVKNDVTLSIGQVDVKQNACYSPGGETVGVPISGAPGTEVKAIIYINGDYAHPAASAEGAIPATDKSVTLSLTGVKIPANYSTVEVVALVKKGSSYLPSQGKEGHRVISKVYRWKTPNRLPVYVRTRTGNPGSYTYSNQMLLPYEGAVVNNFTTAKLELYTPAEDGVKYTWIRTRNGVSETIEGNSIYLEEYDASYSVKAESKECGSPIASNQIKVWSGDIELVAFTGVTALEGVCQSASGGVILSIDLENHSRTLYKAGLPVKFVMTYPDASTENIDIKLPKDLQEQARITIPLPEIPKGKLRIGHNTLKLEFKQIGESADGDGDKSNNTIEGDINVKPSPEVEFEDAAKPNGEIRQKIDRWVFSPKIKSKDGTTYNWTGRMVDDELQAWSASLGRQSTLTVEGTPKYDLYKIAVKNAEGCTTEKIYKLIMTDASLKRIERPFSSCSLGDDNTDVVVVIIGNEGKRPLQKDTEVTVTVKLGDGTTYTTGKEQLDNDIPEGGDYKIIIPAEGLQKKLAGVQNMRLTAEVKLGNLNGKKVEDIESSNDKVTTEIYSYGYPKINVKYTPVSKCSTAELDLENGAKLSVNWPYAIFKASLEGGSNTPEFLYSPKPLDPLMEINDGKTPPDDPHGSPLGETESYLPTKSTMEKSEDRAGKGHYVIRARNSEGCEADVKFDLVLERYALELVESQSTSPKAQCQFPDEKLETQVVVKNVGNTRLPEGTKLKFTAILNDDTKSQGATDEYEVEAAKTAGRLEESEGILKGELPPDYSFPFTIKLPKLNVGRDGNELRIQVKVAFGDETGLQCANLAGNEAVGILKTQDKKDVGTFDIVITPKNDQKEEKRLEKWTYSNPYEYEVDYVALDVENQGAEEFTYQWSWDGGVVLSAERTGRNNDKASGIDVDGAGRVACKLTNKASGCSRESGGYIRHKGLSLAVKWIVSPSSTCKPNVPEAIPVKVWVANVGNEDFAIVDDDKHPKKAFTIKYSVYRLGETTNPLSQGTKDVMFKDLFPLDDGKAGLMSIKPPEHEGEKSDTMQSIKDFLLPDITGMKGLRETDFYIQAELVDINTEVGAVTTRATKKEFQHYASPTIAGEKLGGAKEVFYSATGVIKVTDEAEEELYHNYQWSKVGGDKIQTGESSGLAGATPSSAVVAKPGDYMLTFVDANQCAGSASKTVRFPAYLVFADSDLVLPEKEACALTADEEVAVKVTNMGKEPYTPPSGGVPVNVECTEYNSDFATLSTDLDKKQHLEGARLQLMDAPLAPGATGVMKGKITTTDGKHLSLASEEGQMKFQIMVKIRDEADSSQLVTPPAKRPKREVKMGDVMNHSHPKLGKPLDEMAHDGLGDPSADLMRIPFAKRGFIMSTTGIGLTTDVKWYYTAQGVTDSTNTGRDQKVMRTGEYMLKLTEKYGNQTCKSTYGPVKLRFKPEYVLTPEFDQSSTTQCREAKDKDVGLESPIAIKLKVAPRVVPIAAGDKFTVSYEEENVAGSLHEEELVVENTIDTTAADKPTVLEFSFQIKPHFKAGNHTIKVKVLYKDDLGDPTPGEVLEELHFNIKPAFDFDATFTTENPPIKIDGPEPPAGDSYTYWWSVNSGTGSSAMHDRSGEYFLKVTSNGCTTEKTFLVRIMRKVSWEVENPDMGTFKVELLKKDSDEVERQLSNPDAVSGEAELLITALPNTGHILNVLERQGVEIASEKDAGGYKGKIRVEDKPVELKVGFAQGPDPHAVGVLPEVRIVSPFSRSLELLNTERVVELEVVNQVGAVITHQHIAAGQPRITLEFPNLPEGLYLVRVVDAAGGVRTLRAVKAH